MGTFLDSDAGAELRAKFRAESDALAAGFRAALATGRHTYEKGLRTEQLLVDFLARHLPPRFGVARGEVVDSRGAVARQCDVVIYDALHAPLLQRSEASHVFAAESVYAVIELKPKLNAEYLDQAAGVLRSVKALDRSATVATHEGHERLHGPQANPAPFGAVFALETMPVRERLVPALAALHARTPLEERVDCICILGQALVYHFAHFGETPQAKEWIPTLMRREAKPGYYETGEDTLFLFFLFLMTQLTLRELFPPDLLAYSGSVTFPGPRIYLGDGTEGLFEGEE